MEVIEGESAEYDAREMRELLRDWETCELDWPHVMQVGSLLTRILFPPQGHELLVRSISIVEARSKRLRLRLLLEGRLHDIPKEGLWNCTINERISWHSNARSDTRGGSALGCTEEESAARH